jgi:hypothetical protein
MTIPTALSASASLESAASMRLLKQLFKKPYNFIDTNDTLQSSNELQQRKPASSIDLSSSKNKDIPQTFTVLSSFAHSIDKFNTPDRGDKNNKTIESIDINNLACDLSDAADRLLGCLSNTKGLRETLHSLTNEENFTSMALKDFHEKPAFSI